MGVYKGKVKQGLKFSRTKRTSYLEKRRRNPRSPENSPLQKKIKISHSISATSLSSPIKSQKRIFFKTTRSPSKLTAGYKIPTEILKDLECEVLNDDNIEEPTDDLMENEADQHLLHLLPYVIQELEKEGKLDTLEKFFRLIKAKRFPLNNIAFLLWCDVVSWFDNFDSRQMRYSSETLQFFWVGKKLFGGRFIRFMSGMKNETELLQGSANFDPNTSRINFACPSEQLLSSLNPLGNELPLSFKPGFLQPMVKFKSDSAEKGKSYVLMVDGKKIKRGTDVDLLGFEPGKTLKERIDDKQRNLETLRKSVDAVSSAQNQGNVICDTSDEDKVKIMCQLRGLVILFSNVLRCLRELRVKKQASVTKLKELAGIDWRKSKHAFAIDMSLTALWRIDNVIDTTLKVQRSICEAGAHLNGAGSLFASTDTIDLNMQENVRILKAPGDLPSGTEGTDTSLIKQRSTVWFEERTKMKVTGSTIYQAIGCDGLKRQKEHYDKVMNGVEPAEPTELQQKAMQHGVESEVHQIATLCAIVMPFLFPDLIFHEEGYYVRDDILVSPDGSLRSKDQRVEYAFEGKAPVEKTFTTTLQYKVPVRYMTQTLFEQKVLDASGTIYMSWTPSSCTVYKVLPDESICKSVLDEISDVFVKDNPKRPTKLSATAKQIKADLNVAAENCIFLGEYPSVQGRVEDIRHDPQSSSPYLRLKPNRNRTDPVTYDDLQRHLLLGEEVINESYELGRDMASQVVVYLLADLDRRWKEEEPHAIPVAYFYRGYSLSMDIVGKITESCKAICRSNDLDVVVTAADGEFAPLMVRDRKGNPLTQHQLSKSVWKEVSKLTKSDIVKRLITATQKYTVTVPMPNEDDYNQSIGPLMVSSDDGALQNIRTPWKGWAAPERSNNSGSTHATTNNADSLVPNEDNNDRTQSIAVCEEDAQDGPRYDGSRADGNTLEGSPQNSCMSVHDLSNIAVALRALNSKKWSSITMESLAEYLQSAETLKRFTVKELTAVTKYINESRQGQTKLLKTTGLKKSMMVNQLSKEIADGSETREVVRRRRSVPTLKYLTHRAVMKKAYPKKVLNIAYCNFIWSERLTEWKQRSNVSQKVKIVGLEEELDPYYVPDHSAEGDFEVFVYDKTHLGSNLRKAICLNRVDGISKRAWWRVAERRPDVLNSALIEVSEEGKILDQMKERLARNMLSEDVEYVMRENGHVQEADFCAVFREGLYSADDTPGIPALERCRARMRLINWLKDGVDFGDFPPYGAKIKGLSNILYEGLRSSSEAKLYLYVLAKKKTYCARAPNTLCSESFFSTMQEMDPWGQGVLTSEGVEKQISDFTTLTALKMKKDRTFHIRTKRDAAYPVQTTPSTSQQMSGLNSREVDECRCREKGHISCIVPRDHFFDTAARARLTKKEKPYTFSDINQPAKGEQPIRAQYGYKINETKVMPSKRIGIKLNWT